eukprot:TRINITY_DN17766_c0_g4_i1.p1 TRINITY_DN17766_c0_g4~~TRINITY_DN17766_c0_g4_i1.p1  ORF type:complete len:127 (+),score=11.87 TRINITY_DN17766_c0_g4_i1:307-687(+)
MMACGEGGGSGGGPAAVLVLVGFEHSAARHCTSQHREAHHTPTDTDTHSSAPDAQPCRETRQDSWPYWQLHPDCAKYSVSTADDYVGVLGLGGIIGSEGDEAGAGAGEDAGVNRVWGPPSSTRCCR